MGFSVWNSWLSQKSISCDSWPLIQGKPVRRKVLDPGKFRPCAIARAVWESARLRQLCRWVYVCVRERSSKKLHFCPVLLSMPRKKVKQRASKHCFHTEGHGIQANFWTSWETNASERFPPVISPSVVWSLTSSRKNRVVLSQRMTASPGNLLLHLQLCLDAGKLLVVLTLNFCHCPWPFHRLSSELSLNCLLLQCPKLSIWRVRGNVRSSPWLLLYGCCLHNPRTFHALTKCWCCPGIPLSARSLCHVLLGPPAQPWQWWSTAPRYCLVWLT